MRHSRTIGIVAENPALAAIISMTLAGRPEFRVRTFESVMGIAAYLRIAPLDLIVLDGDGADPGHSLEAIAAAASGLADIPVLLLARSVSPDLRRAALSRRISEVIIKPMSPRYLEERAVALLARRGPAGRPPRLPDTGMASNVVPLFPAGPQLGL